MAKINVRYILIPSKLLFAADVRHQLLAAKFLSTKSWNFRINSLYLRRDTNNNK